MHPHVSQNSESIIHTMRSPKGLRGIEMLSSNSLSARASSCSLMWHLLLFWCKPGTSGPRCSMVTSCPSCQWAHATLQVHLAVVVITDEVCATLAGPLLPVRTIFRDAGVRIGACETYPRAPVPLPLWLLAGQAFFRHRRRFAKDDGVHDFSLSCHCWRCRTLSGTP